jgi:NAD-dependent deacetylase
MTNSASDPADSRIHEASTILHRRTVVLTGAGISAESGLPTFRDASGHWSRFRPSELATPEAFANNPDRVLKFYTSRRHALLDPAVKPNAAHGALAEFEKGTESEFLLVTQNVDDLHERAGSKNLVHMHGELLRTQCSFCGHEFASHTDLLRSDRCPACGRPGGLRPAVVWFGEIPRHIEQIIGAIRRCDLFVAVGTSGSVHPASGFVEIARRAGAQTVEINSEDTPTTPLFDTVIRGPASVSVPSFLTSLR